MGGGCQPLSWCRAGFGTREGAGEGGIPPRWGDQGMLQTLLPAGHLPPCWHQSCALRVDRVPFASCGGSSPVAPRPLESCSGLRTGLICISVLIPSSFQQRVLSAAELTREGLTLPLLQVSPKTSPGSSFPSFPRCLGWSEAQRPPLPAALGFGCRVEEQRVAQLSPLPAAAVRQRPAPVLCSPAPSKASFPRSVSPSYRWLASPAWQLGRHLLIPLLHSGRDGASPQDLPRSRVPAAPVPLGSPPLSL